MTALKRQIIADAMGIPVAIILPMEEYTLVADVLEQLLAQQSLAEKLAQMQHAHHDRLFLADLEATMTAFAHVDTESWES